MNMDRCSEDTEVDAKREEWRQRQAEKLAKKAKENASSGLGPGVDWFARK
jgi:hypothetical protein